MITFGWAAKCAHQKLMHFWLLNHRTMHTMLILFQMRGKFFFYFFLCQLKQMFHSGVPVIPMNFHSNFHSLNWTNYVWDYHQCRPLHFRLKSQIDVKSFAAAQMDLYWRAAVEFEVVAPIFVVLAVQWNSSFIQFNEINREERMRAYTDRCLLICIRLILGLVMLAMNIVWRWTGRWLIL